MWKQIGVFVCQVSNFSLRCQIQLLRQAVIVFRGIFLRQFIEKLVISVGLFLFVSELPECSTHSVTSCIGRTPMKKILLWTITWTFIFLFSGCSIKHAYMWKEYPIDSKRVNTSIGYNGNGNSRLEVTTGRSDTRTVFLGNVGAHQYYGSEQSLAEAIASQLSKELEKRGVAIDNGAGKKLEVTVDRSRFEQGMWAISANIDCTIAFGEGRQKTYSVRNSSPGTVDRAYNGAIALAVIEILNDREVADYINR